MLYNINYDIATLCILVFVVYVFLKYKKLPDLKNKIFFSICFFTAISTLCDIGSALTNMYPKTFSTTFNWITNIGYFLVLNLILLLYTIYTLEITNSFYKFKKPIYLLSLLGPYIIDVILILLTPFFNIVFSISPENSYIRQSGSIILYLISLYYIVYSTIILFKLGTRIEVYKRNAVLLSYVIIIVCAIIQAIFPSLLIQHFGVAFCILLVFFSLQNFDEILDVNTGLFNQSAFGTMTDKALHHKEKFTLICIMIDDFQFLTNTFGITGINLILKNIAVFLNQINPTHLVYYINQGEFCISLPTQDKDICLEQCEIIKERFNDLWKNEILEVKLTIRICILHCPQDADSAEAVIDTLTTASTDARYKIEKLLYARNIDTYTRQRVTYIEQSLKTAIQDGRIDVYYQPLYSTKEHKIIGAEALVRIKDKSGKFIPPDEFIIIAERNGYIHRIGLYVFEHVCRFLTSSDITKYGIRMIDINLSVVQCMQNQLADQLIKIVTLYNMKPNLVNLEITETAAAHTPEMLLINMKKLANAGFEFSLDDYGSGYANINYLLHLPFKMIKIDKDIIWTAFKDKRAFAVLTGIVDMMQKLDMKIVAEGIETTRMVKTLTSLNCDYLQGYYFAAPIPQKDFLELAKNNSDRDKISNEVIDKTKPIKVLIADNDIGAEDLVEIDELIS